MALNSKKIAQIGYYKPSLREAASMGFIQTVISIIIDFVSRRGDTSAYVINPNRNIEILQKQSFSSVQSVTYLAEGLRKDLFANITQNNDRQALIIL